VGHRAEDAPRPAATGGRLQHPVQREEQLPRAVGDRRAGQEARRDREAEGADHPQGPRRVGGEAQGAGHRHHPAELHGVRPPDVDETIFHAGIWHRSF
jgi:hypothetical protein